MACASIVKISVVITIISHSYGNVKSISINILTIAIIIKAVAITSDTACS